MYQALCRGKDPRFDSKKSDMTHGIRLAGRKVLLAVVVLSSPRWDEAKLFSKMFNVLINIEIELIY